MFCPLLFTCYSGSKANLLESCFGGWIVHVWGHLGRLTPLSRPLSALLYVPDHERHLESL